MTEIRKLPKKEFFEKHSPYGGITYQTYEGSDEPVIIVPEGVSSNTLLHEIYHSRSGAYKSLSAYDIAIEELKADEFSKEIKGKKLTYGHFWKLVFTLLYHGFTSSQSLGAAQRALRDMDYKPFDGRIISKLWWDLRRVEKEMKEGKFD